MVTVVTRNFEITSSCSSVSLPLSLAPSLFLVQLGKQLTLFATFVRSLSARYLCAEGNIVVQCTHDTQSHDSLYYLCPVRIFLSTSFNARIHPDSLTSSSLFSLFFFHTAQRSISRKGSPTLGHDRFTDFCRSG